MRLLFSFAFVSLLESGFLGPSSRADFVCPHYSLESCAARELRKRGPGKESPPLLSGGVPSRGGGGATLKIDVSLLPPLSLILTQG